ncbi:hypothetical protein HY411_00855 [Candidatus Gottesmanbacteria bacterium]|nr:hypothetical protein [Candidatus Gottesmanbacteria bacterium]
MHGKLMGQRDLLVMVATALNRYRVPYLLSGSFASSYYGFPRATHDIDFVVEIDRQRLKRLGAALKGLGKGFALTAKELERVSSPEMVNSYHPETGVKVDFWITDGEDFAVKYARRRFMVVDKTRIPLVAPEDLILTKLDWCKELRSERHMQDCVGIWHVQKGKLDESYLVKRADELGVADLLHEVTTITIQQT